jgi:hypothetical protein
MRALLVLGLLLPLPGMAAEPPPTTVLQPGAQVQTPLGSCTLNFVFTDAQHTYLGTAGHCARVNDRVSTPGAGPWGTVVFDDDGTADFALIRVDAAKLGLVSAAVRQWGGPTGVATPATASTGNPVALYGFGLGFSATQATRPREGVLYSNNGVEYRAQTLAVNGDSGAPLLDLEDGRAVGIISRFDFFTLPPTTDRGPTVQFLLGRLASAGYEVELQTAPWHGQKL